MDRSLVLKAKALAKGTQKIDLAILRDEIDVDNIIDAEFTDIAEQEHDDDDDEVIALTDLKPSAVQVTPGRARRATDAYGAEPEDRRPIIAIG